jgi:hypothetical protein
VSSENECCSPTILFTEARGVSSLENWGLLTLRWVQQLPG